jgi:hypothetical protein
LKHIKEIENRRAICISFGVAVGLCFFLPCQGLAEFPPLRFFAFFAFFAEGEEGQAKKQ